MTSKIRWAPRVPMDWLRRLYELDAAGIADPELLDKVGYRLYERCRDCVIVADSAVGRRYACPICRAELVVDGEGDRAWLLCGTCGWASDYLNFRQSWRHMELNADTTFLEHFVTEWDRARTAKQKMLAIDGVIHRWRHETKLQEKGAVGRPLGVNLIEGSRRQVIEFLDRLTSGPHHERWQKHHEQVRSQKRVPNR